MNHLPQIRPGIDGFSAQIENVDLRLALDGPYLQAVRDAFLAHRVLVFPDQNLSLDELEAFTLQIGPFGEDPFVGPMPGRPNVIEVRREAEETGVLFGGVWHSDWSFLEKPPAATILLSREVPPVGGDTLFADGVRAYETLPADQQDRLAGMRAIHSARLAYGPRGSLAKDKDASGIDIVISEEAEQTLTHPMICTHPTNGRRSLFVNPVYTVGIEGMESAESGPLLSSLYAHMASSDFIYRHRWDENMLIMWDNRTVMHSAEGGYEGHRRVMHRTTVAGGPLR